MEKYNFRITVERLSNDESALSTDSSLVFRTESHDNIIELASKLGCSDDKSKALLLGVKLLGEVLLADKSNPLYKDFLPHFGSFMRRLKETRKD